MLTLILCCRNFSIEDDRCKVIPVKSQVGVGVPLCSVVNVCEDDTEEISEDYLEAVVDHSIVVAPSDLLPLLHRQ